mmetsp:Transcript_66085/g.162670  ORF Transcript_66085/g.162670 Transcript_66085/m.162670 type:complete len:652 (+) Transcript_66085:309-2264(+)
MRVFRTCSILLLLAAALSSASVEQQMQGSPCAPHPARREPAGFCSGLSLQFAPRGGASKCALLGARGARLFGTLPLRGRQPAPFLSALAAKAARNALDELEEVRTEVVPAVPQKKRTRGIGGKVIKAEEQSSPAKSDAPAQPKKRRNRGFGSKMADPEASQPKASQLHADDGEQPGRIGGFYSDQEESSEEDLDLGSSLKDAIPVLNPGGESRPAGTRLRSRTAQSSLILPNTVHRRGSMSGARQIQGGAAQNQELQDLMRRSMATRGESQKNAQFVHLNPGSSPSASRRKGQAEDMGVIPLSELARRGLITNDLPSTQSVLASDRNIVKELRVEMAVFVLELVGDNLLSAGSDEKMTVWDRQAWKPVSTLEGHSDWVNGIAVDEAKGIFCTASDDKTVRVWDLHTKECLQVLKGHKDRAHSIAIGATQLMVGCENSIYVWDIATWTNTHRLTNHTHVLRAMTEGKQMSKNVDAGDKIVAARAPANLFGHRVGGIVISGPHMLTSVDDGSIWVWDMKTMEVERKLLAQTKPGVWVRPLLLTEVYDKKRKRMSTKLVSGWADGAIRVYDVRTWQLEQTLIAHNGPVLCLDASDDRLLSTGSDMSVYEWDTAQWKIKRVLRGHRGAVCAVTGSDGQTITASLDGYIKVWDKPV